MNRDNFIKIRVTSDELSEIKRKASAADMNISKYIRTAALCGKIILYDTENIYRMNQLLRSVGVNINQIAMVANAERNIYRNDVDLLRSEVKRISDELMNIVSPLTCRNL